MGLRGDRSRGGGILAPDARCRHRRRRVPGPARALPWIGRGDRGLRTERGGRRRTARAARDPRRGSVVRAGQRGSRPDEPGDVVLRDSLRIGRVRPRDRPARLVLALRDPTSPARRWSIRHAAAERGGHHRDRVGGTLRSTTTLIADSTGRSPSASSRTPASTSPVPRRPTRR